MSDLNPTVPIRLEHILQTVHDDNVDEMPHEIPFMSLKSTNFNKERIYIIEFHNQLPVEIVIDQLLFQTYMTNQTSMISNELVLWTER